MLAEETLGHSERIEEIMQKLDAVVEFGTKATSETYAPKRDAARAYYNHGTNLHQANDIEAAMSNYRKAIQLNREAKAHSMDVVRDLTYQESYRNYAHALMNFGRFEEAVENWDHAIEGAMWSQDPNLRALAPIFRIRRMICENHNAPSALVEKFEGFEEFAECIVDDTPDICDSAWYYAAQLYACAATRTQDEANRKLWIDKAYECFQTMKDESLWTPDVEALAAADIFAPILLEDPRAKDFFTQALAPPLPTPPLQSR